MSATALAIAEASKNALYNDEVVGAVKYIIENKNVFDEEEITKALFMYSAHLTAVTAHLVTSVLLTEEQMNAMMEEISEFEALGKEME